MTTFTVPNGMPRSIFENKYARTKFVDGKPVGKETWEERVDQVVDGNFSLVEPLDYKVNLTDPQELFDAYVRDKETTKALAKKGVMPFSGRHLQHGDINQKYKSGEIFTNCSTSMVSFLKFWLLMKGSGVGRCYDSDLCRVNWDNIPNVRLVLSQSHPDWQPWVETAESAIHKYDSESEEVRWFKVGDSAEGWTKVVEILETAAFQTIHKNKLFIFDFSEVRSSGQPIKGQQGRPASGPIPFMQALKQIISIRGAGMKPWKQAMFVDHYLATCVVVGGIRRSARIAVKSWRDKDIFEFIDIKRGGWLYTANNSVGVDDEFWDKAATPAPSHARRVFEAMISAAYFDKTGEPAFLNQDKLTWSGEGLDDVTPETLLNKEIVETLGLHRKTMDMFDTLLQVAKGKKYPYIVNPCGEIVLAVWGGYCTIGDICLANASNEGEAIEAMCQMAKCLMRTNTMKFLYEAEVKRTNRIGIGLTGLFEFAFDQYGANFHDLIGDEEHQFWKFLRAGRAAVEETVSEFAKMLGVNVPHTMLTMKPSGTISKVMFCTEAAHLPAYGFFVRWVQYTIGSDDAEDLIARGYPHKDVSSQYPNTLVIGFPTAMPLAERMGGKFVTMEDAYPEEQYYWLRLIDKNWLGEGINNQISYTLKYDPDKIDYTDFMDTILCNQRDVRACSVMPQTDTSAYVYVPEERVTEEEYRVLKQRIDSVEKEGYDKSRLECEGGACPIELDLWEGPTEES